ncbi:hypothetical protein RvY_00640 [Ramazzottius varieornatus]|uniref:Mitochondrial nucleoid factor 1 n=1 Tax=Ramazzottius varieornatus TaxID=947166 RepID=A0A1D1UDG4_RAMVA|nr:hypothetical protein RvY_00640 [Ramazzottius varieornatus]
MAMRYKQYLQMLQKWPLDPSKQGRDLGKHLRVKVSEAFKMGDATRIADPAKCDADLAALNRIADNYYGKKFHRGRTTGAMGYNADKCSAIVSTHMLIAINEKQPGWFSRLRSRMKALDTPPPPKIK